MRCWATSVAPTDDELTPCCDDRQRASPGGRHEDCQGRPYGPALMAHLINGTCARNQYARFAWRQMPKLDIVRPKLTNLFGPGSLADGMCDMLKNVYERGANPILLVNRKRFV